MEIEEIGKFFDSAFLDKMYRFAYHRCSSAYEAEDVNHLYQHDEGEYKMNFRFKYANKEQLKNILPQLFEILYSNMSLKYPTGNTREDDYIMWSSYFVSSMQDNSRQLVLMLLENDIIGYFQYSISNNILKMEELQIQKEYHGTGLFGIFYSWLVHQLPQNIATVEAFTDKRNTKTQGVLEHLGLVNCGENKNGKSYHYRGAYRNLLEKYW